MFIVVFFINITFALETVKNLDINKFMGKWFVIAAIPTFVEENCENAYDTYSLNQDGTISINYHAIKNGKEFKLKQKATIIDTTNKSKWSMKFVDPWIPFYSAPYEIIIIEKISYNFMVVGYPDSKYGWIMSRDNFMNDNTYNNILNKLKNTFNYDPKQFVKVKHDN